MLSISDKSEKLIAFIKGGKYDQCGIYLHDSDIKGGLESIELTDKKNEDAMIQPMLISRVALIAGAAGSGKSTLAAKFIKSYKKQHPAHRIYGLSCCTLDDDPAFEGIRIIQIPETDLPLSVNNYSNCLFLFDDIESFTDAKVQAYCYNLIKQILENGRKKSISTIICTHLVNPNDMKFGRVLMNEIQQLTIYPRGSNAHAIDFCLKKYFGLNRLQIDDILTSKSRSVTICRTYPGFILEDKTVRML